jgi:protein-tyrosine phosphatase
MSSWIDTGSRLKLAVVSRPRGGGSLQSDIGVLKVVGVDILVSLLSHSESRQLGLQREDAACSSAGISFYKFPISDGRVPHSPDDFLAFARFLHERASEGMSIGAHCKACIGRSSVLLATIMRLEGFRAGEAFEGISAARGVRVPDTPTQEDWVERLPI